MLQDAQLQRALGWRERFFYWIIIISLLFCLWGTNRAERDGVIELDGQPVAWLDTPKTARAVYDAVLREYEKEYGGHVRFVQKVQVLSHEPTGRRLMQRKEAESLLRGLVEVEARVPVLRVDDRPFAAVRDKRIAKEVRRSLREEAARAGDKHLPEVTWTNEYVPIEKVHLAVRDVMRLWNAPKPSAPQVPSGIVHTVVDGETAWSIAHDFNLTVADLEKLNPGKDLGRLHIGDKIIVSPSDSSSQDASSE